MAVVMSPLPAIIAAQRNRKNWGYDDGCGWDFDPYPVPWTDMYDEISRLPTTSGMDDPEDEAAAGCFIGLVGTFPIWIAIVMILAFYV